MLLLLSEVLYYRTAYVYVIMTIRTFDDVNSMFDGMDSFDDLRRRLSTPLWNDDSSGRQLIDTDEGYALVVDMPGFERDDIDVTVTDGVLTIDAEIEHTAMDESTDDVRTLRGATGSRRAHERMRLPEGVPVDDISATYRNGVLEIRLPAEGVSSGVTIDVGR